MPVDWEFERFALEAEAHLVAGWTIAGIPQDEIDGYLIATGYGKRLAAYKAAQGATRGARDPATGTGRRC